MVEADIKYCTEKLRQLILKKLETEGHLVNVNSMYGSTSVGINLCKKIIVDELERDLNNHRKFLQKLESTKQRLKVKVNQEIIAEE